MKHAIDYHFKVYIDQKFDCNQCSLSQANLHQHIRGAHDSGWVSPCGITYSWPPKMFRHRKKCQQCKLTKQKKETGAENLDKRIGKEIAKKSK